MRPFLLTYLEGVDEEIVIVNKTKDENYGGYQIILRLVSDGLLEIYNPTAMMSSGHELTRQQGHLTVPSSGRGNRIWDGKFVVEYDLVDTDSKGRKYLFMDGHDIAKVRGTRRENEEMGDCADAIDTDDEDFVGMVAMKMARLNENKGPVVSGSTLLTEIKMLAELYREETENLEKVCCLDPTMRSLLLPALPEGTPMFKAAFLTNVMCMGFKVVFYPTILEYIDTTATSSTAVIDAILALQTRLLEEAMPKICCTVEDIIKKKRCVKFFKLDAGGTSNLSLPANVKVDRFALPYHQFKVHQDGAVSITNKELVTTLGVKKRNRVVDWFEKMTEFDTKSKFSKTFAREERGSEWRRNILFSDVSSDIPFRTRAAVMDLDYYVSGLCFCLLNSEYGFCVNKDGASESAHLLGSSGTTKTINTTSTRSEGNGGSTTTFEGVLASNAAVSMPSTSTDDFLKTYDELRRAAGECPLSTQGVALDLAKRVYNDMVSSKRFFFLLMALYNEDNKELGILTNDGVEGFASTIKNVITAKTKAAKKRVAENVFVDKLGLVRSVIDTRTVDGTGEGRYSLALAYGVFQMVLRHLIRDRGISYHDTQEIASNMTNLKWENLDMQDLWEKLHAEETNKPTVETDRRVAERLTEAAAAVAETVQAEEIRGDRLSQLINDINENHETEESIALRDKTIERLGRDHDCSPFASSANGHDTMFLWTVVTFAERFCHLYNAVNNPAVYYKDMVEEYGLVFPGGVGNFEALCRAVKSELDVFTTAAGAKPPVFACRVCVKTLEKKFEKAKNRVNKDILAVKKKELGMTTPSAHAVPVMRSEMSPDEQYVYKVHTGELYRSMFECLSKEDDNDDIDNTATSDTEDGDLAYESGGEDKDFGDEEDGSVAARLGEACVNDGKDTLALKDDVISDFYKRYAVVRSAHNRSALCHRQENVRAESLLIMDKFLSGYIVTPKILKHQNDAASILEEVHARSRKGRNWIIPYTFPVRDLGECSCPDSIRLLTIPESNSTKQLTSAMRFSTLACERKFFADVSHSLGFVKTAEAGSLDTRETEYLFEEPSLDIYRDLVVPEQRQRECLLPRTMARYSKDTYDASLSHLEKHASFFTGLWSLCAKANLETTVLSAVVSSPQEASSLLTNNTSAERRKKDRSDVRAAIDAIGSRKDLSLCAILLELIKCIEMTEMGSEIDKVFFLGLSKRYNVVRECSGVHMWNLLDAIKRCFNESLPVDWRKHLAGSDALLNLVPNAPNTDESGVIFETCRFLSRCTELMMGGGYGRLSKCLSRDEWRSLMTQTGPPSWVGRMAIVYEKVMNTNDSRTTESFVNASSFLTNNNVNKKLSINETKNDKIRFACWEDTVALSIEERIDLLMAVERTNSKMTFSTVLLSCTLYRVLVDGERVEDLVKPVSAAYTDKFIPIIKSLSIVNASWGPEHNMNGQLVYIEKCAERGRFVNIEEDPLFFYRFAAYVLGMRANNDQFFEELMGTVTESFDFNGFDTRNWSDFIEKHFVSFLLGRRAFLVSRPSAFIKRVIGRGSRTDDATSESLRRLTKLLFVKSVDSDELTVADLVMCCIDENDVTASSAEEYHAKFHRFGKKIAKTSSSSIANMASGACSTEQLSKKMKSSRPNDVRVQFNKKPDVNTIERDEEAEADLSYGLYSDTVERAVIRSDRDEKRANGEGGATRGSTPPYRKRNSWAWARKEDRGGLNGRTEDFFDHGSRDDTVGTMTGYANSIGSNSHDDRFSVKENDLLMRKTTDFSNEDIVTAAEHISKLARKLKRQDKIKENICQMIDNITHSLNVTCPISEHDDPREFCLTKEAAVRLMATIREWNSIVKDEAEYFKEECREAEKTNSYDMKLVLCGDYNAGDMGGPSDEIHVFKNPLAKIKKKPQGGEEDEECCAERWTKKSGGGRRGVTGLDGQQTSEDEQHVVTPAPASQEASSGVDAFVRKAQEEYMERHTGLEDGETSVLFKQRLKGDKLLDTSILASVFSSHFTDPYKRSVVPGLMQHVINDHNNELVDKSSRKRKGGNNEDQRSHYAFSSLNVIRVHGELSRTDQCSNKYNSKLVSLYDNISEEQMLEGVSDIITKEDVRVSLRTCDASGEDDYATIKNIWLCNSGIHPRDQIEMFKKMTFRNYNKIWLKMYKQAINMFVRWGVLKKSTIDKPYFCVKYTNMPTNVTDTNPPNAVLHSKFLSKPDLVKLITATHPLMRLRDLHARLMLLSETDRIRYMSFPLENLDDAVLDEAILSREFMTSMYDEKGTFITSRFTNSAVLMFTPGTSTTSYEGLDDDDDFVGKEKLLNTNLFDSYHSVIIEALRHGVFDTSFDDTGRVLRVYDNDMVASNGAAVNVVGLPDSSSARLSEYATKKAVRDTVKDNNHATIVKYSVFGHLTSSFSALNANYNARNIMMCTRKRDREAAGVEGGGGNEWTANDMSMRYVLGRMRGFVFYGDEFPQCESSWLAVATKCFESLYEPPQKAVFFNDWYTISLMSSINRPSRLSARVRACLKVDKRLSVGVNRSLTAPPSSSQPRKRQLSECLTAIDQKRTSASRGVSFLANPVVTLKWFLTRGHHLRLSCTNSGVASLSNFMGNRENKRALEDLPPSSKGLATSFKMKTSRNSCISVDSNRFFLVNGTYLLGGRLEGVNLTTDMFVRCKLRTEKIIVQGALFDANTSSAFLASCIEGTSETRGLPMIEHVSRLVNVTFNDAHMKNYWSVDKDDVLSVEDNGVDISPSVECGVLRPPSVCVDDENYIFLSLLRCMVEDLIKKPHKNAVEEHLSRALKKTYIEVVDQRSGMPNMHSLFYLKSLMNFCGYISGVCTGDGEKAHHLLHALSAIGLNMTPKMVMCIVGELGNNLKSSMVNIVKSAWWDKHADMGVEAFVGKGDASSTDAKLAYVAGKMMIYIMEEVGYQGSAAGVSPLAPGRSPSKKDDNNEEKLDAIRSRNLEIACGLWDRTLERIKTNGTSASAIAKSGKKRPRGTDEDAHVAIDSTPRVINYASDRVSWWNYVKGHVLNWINREKTLASFVTGPDVPFCTSSGAIFDDSPWVRRTDLVMSRSVDTLDDETPMAVSPSEIRKNALDEIKKKPGTNQFRTFKESLEIMKTRLGLNANVWTVDERKGLLVETSAAPVAGTSSTVYALHAFNPLSISNTGLSSRNSRKRLANPPEFDVEDVGAILSRPRESCKAIFLSSDDSATSTIKTTVEQTTAHILNNPGKYGFPCVSIDGVELFNINKNTPERVLTKVAKGSTLKASALQKEIVALLNVSDDPTAASGEGDATGDTDPLRAVETFASIFNNLDDSDTFVTASSGSTGWSKNTAPLNLKERSLLAAIEALRPNSTFSDSNKASSKMNKDSPMTKDMLPGQVSSNRLKQIASTDSTMSVRGLHGRPFTCSASATPVMISNSFLLKFYVDVALYKRMLLFSLNTNYAAKNVEPNVDLGDKIVNSGLRVVHAYLLLKRTALWHNTASPNRHRGRLLKRLEEWNMLTGSKYTPRDTDKFTATFPSVFLEHVKNTKVLELSDNNNMIKLEEAANTFFQAHSSTVMLSARPNTLLKDESSSAEDTAYSPGGGGGDDSAHRQMCIINPKNMDTLQRCVERSKTRGVWGLVNSALRPVLFVDLPFVDTDVIYGEGNTIKLKAATTTFNVSFGVRMPDIDGGRGDTGLTGVGEALMKQLVWSWGATNVKNVMYSCHHLHMMFELVIQETNSCKRLHNVGDLTTDSMSNVAFMLVYSIYIDMFEKYGAFVPVEKKEDRPNKKPKIHLGELEEEEEMEETEEVRGYPVFPGIVINKTMKHINNMSNLADMKDKPRCHSAQIFKIMNGFEQKLDPKYLCAECIKYSSE